MSASTPSPLVNVIVFLAGGLVNEVISSGAVRVTVMDYDTDGDTEDTVSIPQTDSNLYVPAFVQTDVSVLQLPRVAGIVADLEPAPNVLGQVLPTSPRALVVLDGGNFQNVVSDQPIHVILVDYDVEEEPSSTLRSLPGEKDTCLVKYGYVVVDKNEIDRLWPIVDPDFKPATPETFKAKSRRPSP